MATGDYIASRNSRERYNSMANRGRASERAHSAADNWERTAEDHRNAAARGGPDAAMHAKDAADAARYARRERAVAQDIAMGGDIPEWYQD